MEKPPERIYHWMETQLSIARHYGGITFQGHGYMIAYNEEGRPLVRLDVLQKESKEKRDALKARREEEKRQEEKQNATDLFMP